MDHTATPWDVGASKTEVLEYNGGKGPFRLIAQAWQGDQITGAGSTGISQDEAEANAAFIVRACNAHDDLVKALKNLLDYADGMHRAQAHEEGHDIDYETFPEARAALAKAGAA